MLKNYGNIFSTSADDLQVIIEALEAEGFEFAYINDMSGSVIKEIVEEQGE